ncbi:MAG TPA: PEP-CTERM sorting domain-containing protein [Bryobacteraceae bacterium]|nr:PEP-CTERM sorting domain-containing protein [Bryobacteraceae bacterium]
MKKILLTSLLWMGLAGVAQAGFIGNSVDVQYHWPDVDHFIWDIGTIAVTAAPQTVTFQPYFDVTVSGTRILVNTSNYAGVYSGTFNGEYLIDTSVATFPSVHVDPSSVLPGGTPTITIAGNVLEIDFVGRQFLPGEQLVLDVVPEPATFGLLGIAVAALALLRRRRTA